MFSFKSCLKFESTRLFLLLIHFNSFEIPLSIIYDELIGHSISGTKVVWVSMQLLLMKHGGRLIYAGPLGNRSCELIKYFEVRLYFFIAWSTCEISSNHNAYMRISRVAFISIGSSTGSTNPAWLQSCCLDPGRIISCRRKSPRNRFCRDLPIITSVFVSESSRAW